ncbi:hypothetical protein ACWDWO_27050 [Actinopolymorpha singaporensis]
MNAFPRRALGAALLAGVAGVALVVPPAAAATTSNDAVKPGSVTSCAGPTGQRSGTPVANEDEQLTQAFRAFGNSGGGWSNGRGWAASDGVYSTELPGHRIVWLMNDTFLGPVNADESMTDPGFIHGSILTADDDGKPTNTITAGTHDAPESIASPPGAVNGDPWYWNTDGIVDGGLLRVFQARTGQTDDPPPFNFGWLGTDIVTYSADFKVEKVTHTYGKPGGVNWGNELTRCGGYIYIYGVKDSAMHVARARVGHLIDNDWQFWTGSAWSTDPESSTAVTGDVGASYSVTPMNGEFVLTTTSANIFLDHQIYVATAPTPVGPFTHRTAVYTAPEAQVANILAPYNVAAHPDISKPGELIISYNVNSLVGADLLANANNNRPRFVSIRFEPDRSNG